VRIHLVCFRVTPDRWPLFLIIGILWLLIAQGGQAADRGEGPQRRPTPNETSLESGNTRRRDWRRKLRRGKQDIPQ